jgi:hypothetical protein
LSCRLQVTSKAFYIITQQDELFSKVVDRQLRG